MPVGTGAWPAEPRARAGAATADADGNRGRERAGVESFASAALVTNTGRLVALRAGFGASLSSPIGKCLRTAVMMTSRPEAQAPDVATTACHAGSDA